MDLIDEQDRLAAEHSPRVLRLPDHLLHIFLTCGRRIDLPELRFGRIGDHLGQRRLAGAGRPVEDKAADLVSLDRSVQEFVLSDDVLLPHYFFEPCRAQSGSQRRLRLLLAFPHIVKKIHKSSLLSFLRISLE